MAGQTSALLKGFDYQHLLSWYHILSLKKNKGIRNIKLENVHAGQVDDLTVYHDDDTVEFFQVKYHVNIGSYSIDTMLTADKGSSLMEKFWNTWKLLIKDHPKDKIRLILYSNWVHHPDDKILICIDGENGRLSNSFYNATKKSACGKKREEWKIKHGASDQDFIDFTNSLSFLLGKNFTEEMKQVISERMELFGLKHDENAMLVAVGIVKQWIKDKTQTVTLSMLDEKIIQHDLKQPTSIEKSATTYLVTVKDRKFDIYPDYILNWQKYFQTTGSIGGHALVNENDWNEIMLPQLAALEKQVNEETNATLIRARGFARLSAWFAFGFTFSKVAGYQIEVNQQDKLWKTDQKPSPSFKIVSENGEGEIFDENNNTVAVGISVTGSLEIDLKNYIQSAKNIGALLLLRPEKELGPSCFESSGDVAAFAHLAKEQIRDFVKRQKAEKILLFYFGPLSGACFLGHQLNAVCKEIQIMENVSGGYSPSFSLL